MSDSDSIVEEKKETSGGSFNSIFLDSLMSIQLKLFAFVFLMFIIINSDVFINRVIGRFDGTIGDDKKTTSKGTFIQGLFLVLFCIGIDSAIKLDIV